MQVSVVMGNAAEMEADALIATINSQYQWNGGIDYAIKNTVGELFHDQARAASPLKDGDTITTGSLAGMEDDFPSCQFKRVIFVVDDLRQPIDNIVHLGLLGASFAECDKVLLPLLRTGVNAGVYEDTPEEAIDGLIYAVRAFALTTQDCPIQEIVIVVYDDERLAQELMDRVATPVG